MGETSGNFESLEAVMGQEGGGWDQWWFSCKI